jgi:hypothetical protein
MIVSLSLDIYMYPFTAIELFPVCVLFYLGKYL